MLFLLQSLENRLEYIFIDINIDAIIDVVEPIAEPSGAGTDVGQHRRGKMPLCVIGLSVFDRLNKFVFMRFQYTLADIHAVITAELHEVILQYLANHIH